MLLSRYVLIDFSPGKNRQRGYTLINCLSWLFFFFFSVGESDGSSVMPTETPVHMYYPRSLHARSNLVRPLENLKVFVALKCFVKAPCPHLASEFQPLVNSPTKKLLFLFFNVCFWHWPMMMTTCTCHSNGSFWFGVVFIRDFYDFFFFNCCNDRFRIYLLIYYFTPHRWDILPTSSAYIGRLRSIKSLSRPLCLFYSSFVAFPSPLHSRGPFPPPAADGPSPLCPSCSHLSTSVWLVVVVHSLIETATPHSVHRTLRFSSTPTSPCLFWKGALR